MPSITACWMQFISCPRSAAAFSSSVSGTTSPARANPSSFHGCPTFAVALPKYCSLQPQLAGKER